MNAVLLLTLAMGADPTDEQLSLLKTFREEMIAVTPGDGMFSKSVRIGGDQPNEQPQHDVMFAYEFAVARYEVPQNLYEAVMGINPSRWQGPRNSVEMVSFEQAQEFCRRATQLMRSAKLIEPQQVIRLPSEAEWEYIARAGSTTRYSFGDEAQMLGEYGWFTGNAAGNDPPVGAKKANAWGFYDVHGYLWEWCLDAGHENYDGAPSDGSAWTDGGQPMHRVIRGGSWKDEPSLLRSAADRC